MTWLPPAPMSYHCRQGGLRGTYTLHLHAQTLVELPASLPQVTITVRVPGSFKSAHLLVEEGHRAVDHQPLAIVLQAPNDARRTLQAETRARHPSGLWQHAVLTSQLTVQSALVDDTAHVQHVLFYEQSRRWVMVCSQRWQ